MGDIISHIYDVYEDYKIICKFKDIIPIDIEDKWYTHFIELTTKTKDYE